MSTACPSCGRPNNAAAELPAGQAPPAAGDLSICWGCGAVAVFTGEGLDVRLPTPAEAAEAMRDPTVQRYRELRREL